MKASQHPTLTTQSSQLSVRPNIKQKLTRLAIASISTLGLAACQSTMTASSNSQLHGQPAQNVLSNQPQSALFAKTTLNKAIKKQFYSAYAYQADVRFSNENRRDALAKASPLQLAMADDKDVHCDKTHDDAYVALLEQVKANGDDVSDTKYAPQLEQIKQNYLTCDLNYQIWSNAQDSEYTEYAYSDGKDTHLDDTHLETSEEPFSDLYPAESENDDILPDDDVAYAGSSDGVDGIDGIDNLDGLTIDVSQYNTSKRRQAYAEQDYLPDYDSDHTELDVKKAKLLDAYLIQPTRLQSQGVYRPLKGMMTILPSMQYQTRNHTTAISQPIYFDIKNGVLYLWADNFAYPVSAFLDPKLGTQWQNKWLKLELNDGTLPKGFGKDLAKAYLHGVSEAAKQLPADTHKLINYDALKQMQPSLAARHLNEISRIPTSYMISRQLTEDQEDAYLATMYRTIYDDIGKKYPELISANKDLATDAEYAIANDDDNSDDEGVSDEPTITSKKVIIKVLSFLKSFEQELQSDNADSEEASYKDASYNDESHIVIISNQANQSDLVNYAKLDKPHDQDKSDTIVQDGFYGLDSNHHIVWSLQRINFASTDEEYQDIGEGLVADSFTKFSPIRSGAQPFPTLPAHAQTPNAQNSIDIKDYGKSLRETYENGEGTFIGNMLYGIYPLLQIIMHETFNGNDSEDEYSDDAYGENYDDESYDNEGYDDEGQDEPAKAISEANDDDLNDADGAVVVDMNDLEEYNLEIVDDVQQF